MLQTINEQLFLLINASARSSDILVLFAQFCAKYLVYFMMVAWVWNLFFHAKNHEMMMKVVVVVILAILTSYLIRFAFYFPRPFVVGLGTNYLQHSVSSSLPSQHATFVWAVSITLLFNHSRLLLPSSVIALLVSWSRIYLGVHWPMDIIAGMLVGAVSAWVVTQYWQKASLSVMPIVNKHLSSIFK